ncbi:hypothetical protein [Clostridium sp. DL1XJH146]
MRNNKWVKIMIFVSAMQLLSGIGAMIIGVLFLKSKLGDNVGICLMPVLLCCIFSIINMAIVILELKSK